MAKVKFDVTGSDPDDATKVSEPPKANRTYGAKVAEINPGFSKDDDGKPDKSRPRLEVIYRIEEKGDEADGFPVWDYLTFGEGLPERRLDQFLQAFGIANKTKRKGEFDTDKIVGKKCKVRISSGKNLDGDYKPKIGGVFKVGAATAKDDTPDEPDAEEPDEDLEALGAAADENEDGEEAARLTELAEEAGLDPNEYDTWAALAEALAENEGEEPEPEEPEEGDGDEDDLDALAEAADAEDEDAAARLTELAEEAGLDPEEYDTWAELVPALQEAGGGETDYESMELPELREAAKERGLSTKGTAAALVKRLTESDNEDPFQS